MIEHINQMIDANLKLLLESEDHTLFLSDMREANQLKMSDARNLAEIMTQKGILEKNSAISYKLTPFGLQIAENGGWPYYSKKQQIRNELKSKQRKCKIFVISLVIFVFISMTVILSCI